MSYNPNDNPNWSRVYYAITVDMAVRGNFVLGTGETAKEAIESAIPNIKYLFRLSEVTLIREHIECIKRLNLNKGMLTRSSLGGMKYNELNMRYCEAKIHIYGRDRGYNGMSYVLSRKYGNFAEYCYYESSYNRASTRQMTCS